MTPETVAAIAAAGAAVAAAAVSLVALPFTVRAANAAKAQTALQLQAAVEARRPLLWADIRPHPDHRQVMCLFVGNSGPTVAHDVRVVIEPPVLPGTLPMSCIEAQKAAADGITSLAPSRTYEWQLGIASELLKVADQPHEFTLTITGRAPDGATLSDVITVRFEDLRKTSGAAGPLEEFVQEFKHARRERREDHRQMYEAVQSIAWPEIRDD